MNLLSNPLLLGAIASLLTQALKLTPLPFEGKTLAGVLAVLTLLSVGLRLAVALLTGTVDQLDLAALIHETIQAATTAAGLFSLVKLGAKNLAPKT